MIISRIFENKYQMIRKIPISFCQFCQSTPILLLDENVNMIANDDEVLTMKYLLWSINFSNKKLLISYIFCLNCFWPCIFTEFIANVSESVTISDQTVPTDDKRCVKKSSNSSSTVQSKFIHQASLKWAVTVENQKIRLNFVKDSDFITILFQYLER